MRSTTAIAALAVGATTVAAAATKRAVQTVSVKGNGELSTKISVMNTSDASQLSSPATTASISAASTISLVAHQTSPIPSLMPIHASEILQNFKSWASTPFVSTPSTTQPTTMSA
jgi:hypothetical protein